MVQGLNGAEIARALDCTRANISDKKRKYGQLTARQAVLEPHSPWEVPAEMQRCSAYRNLRNHGDMFHGGGRGLTQASIDRLPGFYRLLTEQVLEFDPAIPPQPGFANKGGFALRARTDADAGLLIRVNEHTTMTDAGRRIWAHPELKESI
jgi:hypothetical protein